MERISPAELEADDIGARSERLALSAALGTTGMAINRYRIGPGEGLPGGLHAHLDQEELFVVLGGRATFDVWDPDDAPVGRTVEVDAGEAIRVPPGEFQTGYNESDDPLVVLAIGAPRDTGDTRLPATCPECGRRDARVDATPAGVVFSCPDCGDERVPAPCPECGSESLQFALGEDGPVVVCRDCGGEFADAPLEPE